MNLVFGYKIEVRNRRENGRREEGWRREEAGRDGEGVSE